MAIIISESWSNRGYRRTRDGWVAERSFTSSGTSDASEAIAALAEQYGVTFNASHPLNSAIKVFDVGVTGSEGPEFLTLTASYALPPAGDWSGGPEEDPLDTQPEYVWGKTIRTVDCETQIQEKVGVVDGPRHNAPILNPAGDPFSPPHSRTVYCRTFTVRRWEPFFNVALAEQFENTVNADAMVLGPLTIGVGQMLCASIEPTGWTTAESTRAQVQYEFVIDRSTVHPFQIHQQAKGAKGWWDDGGTPRKGPFVDHNGELAGEILLRSDGTPWLTYYVTKAKKTPIPTPAAYRPQVMEWITHSTGIVAVYQRHKSASFAQLGL